jgi:hypothetical protein
MKRDARGRFVATRTRRNPAGARRGRASAQAHRQAFGAYAAATDQRYRGYRIQVNDLAGVWNVSKDGAHVYSAATLAKAKEGIDAILGPLQNPRKRRNANPKATRPARAVRSRAAKHFALAAFYRPTHRLAGYYTGHGALAAGGGAYKHYPTVAAAAREVSRLAAKFTQYVWAITSGRK